jgi:hypothetical protein
MQQPFGHSHKGVAFVVVCDRDIPGFGELRWAYPADVSRVDVRPLYGLDEYHGTFSFLEDAARDG